MTEAPRLLRMSKEECFEMWICLDRNLCGHPVAGLLWERKCEDVPFETGWEKVPTWKCLHVHNELALFLSVFVDEKMIGKAAEHGSQVENSAERSRPRRSNAIVIGSSVFQAARKERQSLIHKRCSPKTSCSKS